MNDTLIMVFGIFFIFLMTTLGSALIFFFKKEIPEKWNSLFLGFASGIMIAASVWSLLLPSIEQSEALLPSAPYLPSVIGVIIGSLFLILLDKVVPHMHKGSGEEEGIRSSLKKPMKLFLAVTLHNVPEGLAVGFAFGIAMTVKTHEAFIGAFGLALGIGIQNFPEGAAVSLPMKASTGSRMKAFLYGMGSGIVEPVAAVVGILLASALTTLQPWLLSFAAGAMLFVVAEDLIPDAKIEEHPHLGAIGFILGFVLMMLLDVALG